jgi:hypothetical protein
MSGPLTTDRAYLAVRIDVSLMHCLRHVGQRQSHVRASHRCRILRAIHTIFIFSFVIKFKHFQFVSCKKKSHQKCLLQKLVQTTFDPQRAVYKREMYALCVF